MHVNASLKVCFSLSLEKDTFSKLCIHFSDKNSVSSKRA